MRDCKRKRRVPSKGLLEDRVEVRQRIAILEGWEAVSTDDIVQLGLGVPLSFGEHGHREEEGREDAGGLCVW